MQTILNKKQAGERTGYHPEYLMELVRKGRFPPPIRLGPSPKSAVRFVAEEVDEWIADRIAERDAASCARGNPASEFIEERGRARTMGEDADVEEGVA